MTQKKLGLIINPIAGIGGRVGLKGSDGLDIQQAALALGAVPQAAKRAAIALEMLLPIAPDLELWTAPDEMGEAVAHQCGFTIHQLGFDQGKYLSPIDKGRTTARDTLVAAKMMRAADVDLILFAGGDGTARDIYRAVGNSYPVLGIPAGVKIHSAVFGISPRDAGELALNFLQNKRVHLKETEVVDLDENAYRCGQIKTQLYGYLTIPFRRRRVQNQKIPTPVSDTVQAQAIAADIIERMTSDQAYVLGPGTTTRAIAERLGLSKTLVGVDILTPERILANDVNEQQILGTLSHRPLKLIITPTGGQGFLFGRGNQQISPRVIRKIGKENIQVICLSSKIAGLRGRPFLVDTGNLEIDNLLSGYIEVISGYHEKIIYKIEH